MKKILLCLTLILTFATYAKDEMPFDPVISWLPVTVNVDGSPITDLGGYKIHCGTAPADYTITHDTGNVTEYRVKSFLPVPVTAEGVVYYCVVSAYNASGGESVGHSNEVTFPFKRLVPADPAGARVR